VTGRRPTAGSLLVARFAARVSARFVALLATLLLAAPPLLAAVADEPRLECKLERESIYEGEAVDYVVTVLDGGDATPDLSAFTDFEVVAAGVRPFSSTFVENVNGRFRKVERTGADYRFSLTPRTSGRLTVPAPTVTIDGRKIAGDALPLVVVPPDAKGRARLRLEFEPAACYPQRPVKVRLRIDVRRPAGDPQGRDPVMLLGQLAERKLPQLQLPWIPLPSGLEGKPWNEWLAPYEMRGAEAGFVINELKAQGGALMLFDDRPRYYLFDLNGRAAGADDVARLSGLDGVPDEWFSYSIEQLVTPTRPGRIELAPASLKGRFITSIEGRHASLDELYARSEAATLLVREPPAEGRPATWTNAIGRFELAADLTPRAARVGDPLTLTLLVTGSGNLDELEPPDLAALPAFAPFRVHAPTSEAKAGGRLFTWSVRPRAAATTEVPPLPMAWFDPEREQWVERSTPALPLEVSEATALDPSAIVAAPQAERSGPELAARQGGVFAHDSDPRRLGDERVAWKAHAAASGALPLLTAAGLLAARSWRRRHADPRLTRRRRAVARAKERLAALDRGAALAPLDLARELRAVVAGLVADVVDRSEAALTAREAGELLVAAGADGAIAEATRAALEGWEALRFSGAAHDGAALRAEARARIDVLARELERCGALR